MNQFSFPKLPILTVKVCHYLASEKGGREEWHTSDYQWQGREGGSKIAILEVTSFFERPLVWKTTRKSVLKLPEETHPYFSTFIRRWFHFRRWICQFIENKIQRKPKDVELLTIVSYCFKKKMHFLFVLVTLPSSSAVNILRLYQFLVLIMYLCFPSIFIVAELIVHSIHIYIYGRLGDSNSIFHFTGEPWNE